MLFFYFRYVFLEGAHKSGQLSSPEYALMKQWFNFSVDKFRKQIIPDLIGILYLNLYITNISEHNAPISLCVSAKSFFV